MGLSESAFAEWNLVFEEDFDTVGWEKQWGLKGSAGPVDQGALE